MALITCRECKGQVSSTAKTCPHCGAKVKKPHSVAAGILGGVILVGAAIALSGGKSEPKPPPTPEARAAAEKASADSAADLARVCVLRQALKNPDSFKLVQAIRTAAGELCVEYRGTNSFNAVITESVKFPPIDSKKAPQQGGACTGRDVTGSLGYNLSLCR
jgi:hypothetical protein